MIKGVSPNAEIIENENGGKQSKTSYGFHLIDADAILSLAEVLQYGASRYTRDNWRKIPSEEHFNHMLIHYYAWLKGDTQDDHLGHFFCRAMMLYATGKQEPIEDKPCEDKSKFKVGDKVRIREDLEEGKRYGLIVTPIMAEFRGNIVTINDISNDGNYRVKENLYYWSPEMLELIPDYDKFKHLSKDFSKDTKSISDFTELKERQKELYGRD